jgi:hypothetical protein
VQVPAVVAAGDRGAARAIHGESKAYLAVGERPLVAEAVLLLQRVPEVSEVFVVGDAERLAKVLGEDAVRRALRKPLTIVPQFRNLYENAWETYRRLLPGASPDGRDPASPADLDQRVFYLSADLPFATAEELSAFVRRAGALDCDYALGLVTAESMEAFYPEPGKPGIHMAYFVTGQGRMRQSNLHLVKPAKLGNRHYIEEMYEHRYQKQLRPILGLAWRLLRSEGGGFAVLRGYARMHLAGYLDRKGFPRLADRLARSLGFPRIERLCGRLLRADVRLVVTEAGGCGVDVDNEEDFDTARARFAEWRAAQEATARRLYGALALPEPGAATGALGPRVLEGRRA